jgi:hypothetical protein
MRMMKATGLLFGAALLFSSGAIAGEANKGTLRLSDNVVVDGKSINSGDYKVEWDGSGPTVQVTLLRGKQTVATFSAHLTEQAAPNQQDAYSTTAEPDGSRALTAIYPGGKRLALKLDQTQAGQQSTGSAAN